MKKRYFEKRRAQTKENGNTLEEMLEQIHIPVNEALPLMGCDISPAVFLRWLRSNGFLSNQWAPTEKSHNGKLLRVCEEIDSFSGSITRTVDITPKGVRYFSKLLKND